MIACRESRWISIHRVAIIQLSFLCAAASLLCAQTNLRSRDGYVRHVGNEWIMGTSLMERRIRLANGQFSSVSLRNKVSGREYQDANSPPVEIRFSANGQDVSASGWRWELRSEHAVRRENGRDFNSTLNLNRQVMTCYQTLCDLPWDFGNSGMADAGKLIRQACPNQPCRLSTFPRARVHRAGSRNLTT